MDYSPPGSSVCAIFQATILQQVAISYPRGSSWPGIEPESLHLLHWQVDSLPPRHLGRPLRITYNLKTHWILTLLWKEESEVTQSCMTLCDPVDCSLPGSHPWDFPGKSNGVGCKKQSIMASKWPFKWKLGECGDRYRMNSIMALVYNNSVFYFPK